MTLHEDCLIDFMLLRKAKSFIYIYYYGYLYVMNEKSKLRTMYKNIKNINEAIRDSFLYIKFLFDHTENNEHEELIPGEEVKIVYHRFYKKLNFINFFLMK